MPARVRSGHWLLPLPLVLSGLLAPWIGALADTRGRRRMLLMGATLVCCAATALLVTVKRGDIASGIALFVLAQLGYMIAAGLYNSYLPHIAPAGRTARVSGFAWGLSYIGGLACMALCLPFTRDGLEPAKRRPISPTPFSWSRHSSWCWACLPLQRSRRTPRQLSERRPHVRTGESGKP